MAPNFQIREERLRTLVGLRGSPALALSAWKGRSGRRYVVGIHDLALTSLADAGEAVLIAARRDGSGIAEPVAIVAVGMGPGERLPTEWLAAARRQGATELHVHRLAEGEDERRAIVADLTNAEQRAA